MRDKTSQGQISKVKEKNHLSSLFMVEESKRKHRIRIAIKKF